MKRFLAFLKSSVDEAKKLHKPTKKEVYVTTLVVFAGVFLTAIFITFSDFVISKIIMFVLSL